MRDPIYLDYNATTPVAPEVAEAMAPCLTEIFGNPSSGHAYGRRSREVIEAARQQVARLLGADPTEIVFTSGGTESNNFAIVGAAMERRAEGNHIVTTAVEHPAVSLVCRALAAHGFESTFVPVDEFGRVDPEEVEAAIRPETVLVTVMHANNEVGTIEPVAEIGRIARRRGIPMHTDAAQSVGKLPVNVDALEVDLLSIAGHKLYAPKGVGALYIRTGTWIQKLMHGADHEADRRPGTENILEIVGLGAAAELALAELPERAEHLRALRDRLHDGLRERIDGLVLNGHPEERLPNTLSISVPGVPSNRILAEMPGVAAGAGAACHADGLKPSATLEAMGVPPEVAMGTLRLTTGRFLTEAEADRAVEAVAAAVERVRTA